VNCEWGRIKTQQDGREIPKACKTEKRAKREKNGQIGGSTIKVG